MDCTIIDEWRTLRKGGSIGIIRPCHRRQRNNFTCPIGFPEEYDILLPIGEKRSKH